MDVSTSDVIRCRTTFAYRPLDRVHVIPLEAGGRVMKCQWDVGDTKQYLVEFYLNGDQKNTWFYPHDLCPLDD